MNAVISKIWEVVRMRSLRARIFLILLVIGIVPTIISQIVVVNVYEDRAVESRAQVVQNQLMILANHLVANDFLNEYSAYSPNKKESHEIVEAELDMLASLYEGRVMIIGSNFKVLLDTYGIAEGKTMISEEVIACFQGQNISKYDSDHGYIEMTTPITDTTDDGNSTIQGVMLTSISSSTITQTITALNTSAGTIVFLIVLLIIVFSVFISGLLTAPFEKLSKEIGAVKAGYTNEPISVNSYTETSHISDAFNQVQGRMNVLDQSREEFVANVSHELRTPMTSMKVLADSLLAQEEVPNELYREFMEDIVSEIDRENNIISDLLALVKMDKTAQNLDISKVDINSLSELTLKRLRPIAKTKDIEITFESNREIVAEVDEVKISLAMSNLVENAIKYNHEHGYVKVTLDADYQNFTFTVEDSGDGIPEDALEKIYERFFRVDKSHSREIGGTGLGLAITRNVILMHRGTIDATSTLGEGSTFVMTIPLKYYKN